MTREDELATILKADATLMALLIGGVYTDEEIGVEGIHRGDESTTKAAFDAKGYLLPCAVVRQASLTPFSDQTRFLRDKFASTTQIVSVYFYQDRGTSVIHAARQRTYELLEGERLGKSYPIMWSFDSPVYYDVGPVANSRTLKQDWQVISNRQPVGA